MVSEIDIRNQPPLGWRRLLRFSFSGVRYRLFRSSVLVMIVTVAVAFFINTLVGSLIEKATRTEATALLDALREPSRWMARIAQPKGERELLEALGRGGASEREELARFGGVEASGVDELAADAEAALSLLERLEELPFSRQYQLWGERESTAILDYLADAQHAMEARASLTREGRSAVVSQERLESALASWRRTVERLDAIRARRAEAMDQVRSLFGERPAVVALEEMDTQLREAIRKAGFLLEAHEAEEVALEAKRLRVRRVVEGLLLRSEVQAFLARELGKLPEEIGPPDFWRLVSVPGDAEETLAFLSGLGVDLPLTAEGLAAMANRIERERELARVVERTGAPRKRILSLPETDFWLIVAALVVTVVGTGNAMLMAVTERYREIATLKCLGAKDGSILAIFVLEGCFLGGVGGVLGAFCGLLIASGRTLLDLGRLAAEAFPWAAAFISIGLGLIVATLLASVASFLPALKAARLSPIEAMRIE